MIESLARPSSATCSTRPTTIPGVSDSGPDLKQARPYDQGRHESSERTIAELRFVAVHAIRAHEQYATTHRDDLAARLDHDTVLRNPIVVAEVRPGAYVLLDGTHRLAYLQAHGYSHALVQVVALRGQASVQLSTWAHIAMVDEVALLEALARSGCCGVTPIREQAVAAPDATDVAWLSLAHRPHVVYRLQSHDRVAALSTLVSLYQPERLASDAVPASGTRVSSAAFRSFPAHNVLVQFAPFAAADICALHDAGDRIPSGITRVIISGGRVLGTNAPLRLLRPETSFQERAAWLASLYEYRPRRLTGPTVMYEPAPRRYAEPLVVFDWAVRAEPLPVAAAAA